MDEAVELTGDVARACVLYDMAQPWDNLLRACAHASIGRSARAQGGHGAGVRLARQDRRAVGRREAAIGDGRDGEEAREGAVLSEVTPAHGALALYAGHAAFAAVAYARELRVVGHPGRVHQGRPGPDALGRLDLLRGRGRRRRPSRSSPR